MIIDFLCLELQSKIMNQGIMHKDRFFKNSAEIILEQSCPMEYNVRVKYM